MTVFRFLLSTVFRIVYIVSGLIAIYLLLGFSHDPISDGRYVTVAEILAKSSAKSAATQTIIELFLFNSLFFIFLKASLKTNRKTWHDVYSKVFHPKFYPLFYWMTPTDPDYRNYLESLKWHERLGSLSVHKKNQEYLESLSLTKEDQKQKWWKDMDYTCVGFVNWIGILNAIGSWKG